MKLYVILSDVHDRHPETSSPHGRLCRKAYHPAYLCVEKVIEAFKPNGIISIGDMTDLDSLNSFDKDKRRRLEGKRYRKDLDSLNHLLDRLDKITPKNVEKIYLLGNHEDRIRLYLDYHPELEGSIDFGKDAHLADRGYEVIPYNSTKKIGKAMFMHGFNASKYHSNFMASIYPKTIFYGHTHDIQTHSFVSPIDQKEVRVAESLGCLCDLNPSWLRGKPNKWIHAFGMLWVKDNGEFQMDRKIIIKGEAIIDGKIFKG
jgi:predicted phosphodiesterase